MVVFIEYAIADNLIMDYLLLKAAMMLTKNKINKLNLFFAALIGCFSAIVIPLIEMTTLIKIIVKLITALIMCVVAISKINKLELFKLFNAFILLTFATGGSVYGILNICGIMPTKEGYYKGEIIPVGISILIAYVCFVGIKKSVEYFFERGLHQEYYDCIISFSGRKYELKAFYDSGNLLKDTKSGLPIIVCNKKVVKKILWLDGIINQARKINITTACGEGSVLIIDIDSIMVKLPNGFNKTSNATLGVLLGDGFNLEADLIIGSSLIR